MIPEREDATLVSPKNAKSQLEEKLPELETLIKQQRNIRNWIPAQLVEVEMADRSKSLAGRFVPFGILCFAGIYLLNCFFLDLIQGIVVGCMNYPDAYPLDDILDKVTLCDKNVHFYKLHCDGAMTQALSGADMKVINVNRLIILLGPPGTGKTTLCRGVAQHLSIRLNSRFSTSVMVEINSHSLFSKWFSESGKLVLKMFDQIDEMAEDGKCLVFVLIDESGKLVLKMFDQIDEMAEDGKCLVFVLIDEVESLGMSRDASTSRGDPADSIRAVNALLTQIDRIRRRTNVIVLCTSNLEDCLDSALLDRADVVKHVGQPSIVALYTILGKCIEELIRIGVVISEERLPSIR
ncbi:unnamed protein product, partial [Strongylus vulgaris]